MGTEDMRREMRLTKSDARRLLSSPPNGDLIKALQVVIRTFRDNGWLSITQTADLAGMSERAFQRELAGKGLDFSKIVNEVRAELATEMLKDRDLTLTEISTALGYSTPSNFARAFERWTEQSPTEFRRGL
jgi:AraC-like DNA-binding protein